MMTLLEIADLPGGAVRSRFMMPAKHLQCNAEAIFIVAGEIELEVQSPGQVQLFADMISIGVEKGFHDADILRSLIRGRTQPALMRELVREVIEILGGAGCFFDLMDMITWPDEGVAQ
jgi:hypothetical protein